ncbi:MAG TPA: aminotransferase class I/II-fold pyridoxal phosphate-dependent enzyme [Clostridia bacterium]|nr:aminotransferase class I/II-fold pyridoxal phosphate-dependent enzyme [Clostridia bacterium]
MDLLEYIVRNKNAKLPMHMPGHKRNASLAPYLAKLAADCDMTEIEGFDNLHGAEGVLREGMDRMAALWGSKQAFWLVNGSTCGILAGIRAALPEGGRAIVARNCHGSVYNGLLLRHARPVYLIPEIDAGTGISGALKPMDVSAALERNPDAKLVILTSPTYEGVVSDIEAISRIAHTKGVPVLVDEAHGAHLGFGCGFPGGALAGGADIAIHSLHKTLPSLTQTAALHLKGDLIEKNAVAQALSIFETSSPSYLLMASISGCTALVEERGRDLFEEWRDRLTRFSRRAEGMQNLSLFKSPWTRDPSKLVVCTAKTTLTGAALSDLLRHKHHIEVELACTRHIVAMTGMGDTADALDAFADALLAIDEGTEPCAPTPFPLPTIPGRALAPWETENRRKKAARLCEALGRVSAETVWAYPPGIPLLLPGEELTQDIVEYMQYSIGEGIHLKSSSDLLPERILTLAE